MKMALVYVSELRMGQFWLAPKWIMVSKKSQKCSSQFVGDSTVLFQPTKQDGAIDWLYYNPYNQQCPKFLGVNLNEMNHSILITFLYIIMKHGDLHLLIVVVDRFISLI